MRELMQKLIKAAENLVGDNTNTSLKLISPAICDRAKKALDEMETAMGNMDVLAFNKALVKLYCAIPRSMKDRDFLEFSPDGLDKRLKWEAEFLDAIEGAVSGLKVQVPASEDDKTRRIMTANGITGEPASEEDLKVIRKLMGSDAHKLVHAWKVCNSNTENRFNACPVQNRKLLWHGSDTGNFFSILTKGLSLSKASYGMFGKGIYFASDFDKSRGYCSARNCRWHGGNDSTAMLGIFEVAMGEPLHLSTGETSLHAGHPKLKGKDCAWGHKGNALMRDEIIIYNESQCTIRYIVETA